MKEIVLKNRTASGMPLEATYLPDHGMNMISFKMGSVEVIDQSTRSLFEERSAGLGALIGPHFHRRRSEILPRIKDENLFPHIARVKAKGIEDPFSHGIARYAPWQAQATPTKVTAAISGKDAWNGIPLAELEGQNFKMLFASELTSQGLSIDLSVVSDADSLVGLHYYYYLPNGKGTITSRVHKTIIDQGTRKSIPESWLSDQHRIKISLDHALDCTFTPFPNPLEGHIVLDTEAYSLATTYSCLSQENSWQLYHPQGSSFVCIEPLSSQDPRHPNLTVSSLNINLQILEKP